MFGWFGFFGGCIMGLTCVGILWSPSRSSDGFSSPNVFKIDTLPGNHSSCLHEVPFEPFRCSDASGRSWLPVYQKVHGQMVEGRRDVRVAITQYGPKDGLGDMIRGLLVITYLGAVTGRMSLFGDLTGRRTFFGSSFQSAYGPDDALQHVFEPRTIMWNCTEVHTMNHRATAQVPSDVDFLRHLMPVGISPGVVKSEMQNGTYGVTKVDEKFRSRVKDLSNIVKMEIASGNRRSDWTAFSDPSLDAVTVMTSQVPFVDHLVQLIEDTACCPSDASSEVRQKFHIDGDILLLRKLLARQSTLQLVQCSVRMLFNSLAAPVRDNLSGRLAAVAELYRSQALKLDAWPQRSASNPARLGKYKTGSEDKNKCDGLTLTQCLGAQLGIQTRPLVGVHYRVGDQAFNFSWYRFSFRDKRNMRWDVKKSVACGRALAASLGFVRPVFLLSTDDENMKNAIRHAHSKNQTAIFYDTRTGKVIDERPEKMGGVEEVHVADIIVPNSPPSTHIVSSKISNKVSVTVDLFAEVLTLATTDALVLTQSGFGRLAWLFGGHPPSRVAAFNWERKMECVLEVNPNEMYWGSDFWKRFRRGRRVPSAG